ncbi:ATP-binding protein [Clostridium sp. Marseille-Q2269]|uniref:AAA family ATPase n=1 Tax=Clostridium sp. Marseille-Q2269 TaxID=2942205 RepID=UPI00207420E9|nr:ATP-binding protein [Clostridium sp. Marseille-Q2269]
MLLEFTVRNFLSIKDEVTLSMIASKDDFRLEDNTMIYEKDKVPNRALNVATLYGANASGKTNILKAMSFASFFINKSHEMQQGKIIPRIPFKLDRSYLKEPSEFRIVFIYEEIKYVYMFSVMEQEVMEEYLYYYPKGRQSIIFERVRDEYKFTNDIELQRELKNKFHSKNKLFLSTESLWEYEKAKKPFKWLSEYFNVFIDHENLEAYTGESMVENNKINEDVKKYMKYADMDIDDINVKVKKKDDILSSEIFKIISDDTKSDIINHIDDDSKFLDIKTIHKGIDEKGNPLNISFDLSDESDGTQKYFGILGPLIKVLRNGYTVIIDELDIRLHTLLVMKLVELFSNPNINKNKAQLIFSTHDTNLLDRNILRRDQIWFTEKKEDKSTDLYSLYEFGGVRKNDKIEKGYLQGKYGAIPFFKGDLI